MERDLWKCIVASLKSLPRRWAPNGRYSNRDVLAVYFWAVLHHRPTSWACRRCNWPMQAWRRKLPNQSTMSRRLRDPQLDDDMRRVLEHVQRRWPTGRLLLTDGKAFALNRYSRDPDARTGRGTGCYAFGYKLHVIIDDVQHVCGWRLYPMNHSESRASAEIVRDMAQPKARLLVGDAAYDSNPLHAATSRRRIRLIAPRRKPGRGLGHGRLHHPHRLQSIRLTETRDGWMWPMLHTRRGEVERFFSGLVTSAVGVDHLPSWVRRLHRSRLWVAAKLVINAARIARNRCELA